MFENRGETVSSKPDISNLQPFKKGQSGNPNGRPKGALSRSTLVKKWLLAKEDSVNPITNKVERMTQADIATLALIQKAKNGDVNAFKELMDSGFGKVTDKIEMDAKVENTDTIDITLNL